MCPGFTVVWLHIEAIRCTSDPQTSLPCKIVEEVLLRQFLGPKETLVSWLMSWKFVRCVWDADILFSLCNRVVAALRWTGALFFPSHVFTGEIPTLLMTFVCVTDGSWVKQQTATKSWKWTVLLYPVSSCDSALKPADHAAMGKNTPATHLAAAARLLRFEDVDFWVAQNESAVVGFALDVCQMNLFLRFRALLWKKKRIWGLILVYRETEKVQLCLQVLRSSAVHLCNQKYMQAGLGNLTQSHQGVNLSSLQTPSWMELDTQPKTKQKTAQQQNYNNHLLGIVKDHGSWASC